MANLTNLTANGQAVVKIFASVFKAGVSNDLISQGAALLDGGMTKAQLYSGLLTNSNIQAAFPLYTSVATSSAFVGALVDNVFANSGVATAYLDAVKTNWTTRLDTEYAGARGTFMDALLSALMSDANATSTDTNILAVYNTINNRAEVGATLALSGASPTFTTMSALQTQTATVTNDSATITTAVAATGTGSTFTLTTGSDNISGTSGNDTIVGILSGALATGSTVQPGDQISGGSGTDTFNLNISGDAGGAFTLASVTTTGVEKILVSNYDANGGDTTIDMSTMSDVATLGTTGSAATGDTIFTNVKAIAAAEAKGAGDVTVTYASSAVSGTSDTQTVSVDNFTGALTLTEVETVTVGASGTKSTIGTLTTDGGTQDATTLNINASVALTITTDLNTNSSALTKIDASGSTAAVTLTTSDTGTTTMTFGSGDDVLIRNANAAADTVSGGSGTDTLKVTTGANVTSVKLANYTSFETLELTDAGGETAVSLSGITQFTKVVNSDSTTGTTEVIGAGAGVALAITVANGGDENTTLSLATDTTADSINVAVGPAGTSTTAVAMGTLTLNNHETINIASAGAANSIAVLTSSAATKVVATGAKDLTLAAFTSSSVLKTIDASAMTGAFIMGATSAATAITVTGGTGNDTIIGGAGKDSLVGGTGDDSITGAGANDTISAGDGADTIVLGGADGEYNADAGAGNDTVSVDLQFIAGDAGTDTIVGGSGTDTLKVVTTAFDWNDVADTADLANITGFEAIEIGFAATTYTIGDGVMANFNNDVTINSKITGAVTLDASSVLSTGSTVRFSTTTTSDNSHIYVIGNGKDIVNYSTETGTNNNTVKVTNAAFLQSTDSFVGSTQTDDTLLFDTDAAMTITAAQLGGMSATEVISVNNTNTKSGAVVITLNDTVVNANKIAATGVFAVSRDTDESGTFKVDGSAVTSGNLSITGADAADTLIGGSGNDTITGGDGAAAVIDVLTGGTGNDTFNWGVAETGLDVVTDFDFGTSTTSVDVLKVTGGTWQTGSNIATASGTGTYANAKVIILDTTAYADLAAMNTAVTTSGTYAQTGTADSVIVWQDTLGKVHFTYDANGETTAGQTDLATLTGVTIATVAANATYADFSLA